MCGIVGILNLENQDPISEDLLTRMISVIRHRGPDETGIYVNSHVGLGHARLSIIGLEGGTQPISNEDGSLWITYNGEIFNYIELKEELTKKGHVFSTQTDTEVIVHLYEELGPKCLEKMNGQFALAIWDTRKKELFLARDRVGIRPLFYTRANGRFLFASEIKAIFMDPAVPREIDPESLYQVFTFWTTLSPRTVFKDIYELPPGHTMTVKEGRITQRAFWTVPVYSPEDRWKGSFEEAKEELKVLLIDATRLRLRADVPVGAYLSGGLDSSLITAIIAKHFNNRLKTFSMSFEEKVFDETEYQDEMQKALGTEHRRTVVTNALIRENFPDVVRHCEIPLLRTAPVPLFLLSGLVRENDFKVVLTGEGSDEIFGGYNIFREAKVRHFWAQRPDSKIRPLLIQRLYPYIFKGQSRGGAFLQKFFSVTPQDLQDPFFSHKIRWENSRKNVTFFSEGLATGLNGYNPLPVLAERLPLEFGSWDVLSKAQYLEMSVFLSNYLLSSQGDRPAMAHSLEIRLPFLDYRVIDFAFRLPARWKIKGLKEKYILKQASQGLVTDAVKERPKQPYRAPIREVFFNGKGGDYVDHFLSEESVKRTGYFNPNKVALLVQKYRKPEARFSSEFQNMAVVGILSTQILHDQFIANFPGRDVAPLVPDKVIRIRQD
jgi:asparagine synthase (glutamine-hydrolysing)